MRRLTPEEQNALPPWYDEEHIAWLKRHERREWIATLFTFGVYLLTLVVFLAVLVISILRTH